MLCTYKFIFSVNSSPGDKLCVEFTQALKTGPAFGVGTTMSNVKGKDKVSDPEGKEICVPYPLSLYATLFNTGSLGEFIITYYYKDGDPGDANSLFTGDFTIEDKKGKYYALY